MARFFRDVRNALILFFLLLASGTSAFAQHTYYISKSIGSDSNTSTQAQSKSTPWAHLPGMASCASACASYTPVAGDIFIQKGCDTWVNSDLPVLWNWSGSSGSPITITVDKTWYNTGVCASAWNRPIWNAANLAITVPGGEGTINTMFVASSLSNTSYVTLDNIEMKGLYIASGSQGDFIDAFNTTSNWTLSNLYIHAWKADIDNCTIVQFQSNNNLFTTGVIDGSDSTGAAADESCYAFYPGIPNIENSVIHDVPNGVIGYSGMGNSVAISGNLIYNITNSYLGANHCNTMEIVGAGTEYIHDNVLHDIECSGGEVMMVGSTGETSYIWNNVLYNNSVGQPPNFPQTSGQTITGLYFWNNTIVTGNSDSCFYFSGQPSGTLATLVIENNHCITTAASTVGSLTGLTIDSQTIATNTQMTPTVATGQGYTAPETYAYSPTAGTNGTIGAGANLGSNCTGLNAGLCSDTTYACTQQTIGGVIQAVCPVHTAVTRPSSAAWDVGAYQYAGAQGSIPNAPTGLSVAVQ